MTQANRRLSRGRKWLIGILAFIALAAIAFHVYVTRYLPPLVQKRLAEVIVNGSDSLYRFEMGKFDLSFWGGRIDFEDLRISVDSARYKKMEAEGTLPPMSCGLVLQKGQLNGISLGPLIFSKKIKIREIFFDTADLQLNRHFKQGEMAASGEPLWKLIQPRIRSIAIGKMYCADLRLRYRNIDSADVFKCDFEKSDLVLSGILIDSTTANDSSRLMFAKNVSFRANNIKMSTNKDLYKMTAGELAYQSSDGSVQVKKFDFAPAVSNQAFINHYGYQHEIYRINVPVIQLKKFALQRWINNNQLITDTMELMSPSFAIYLDRNAKPNPYSKKGNYPHQLLQKLPFLLHVQRLKATDASVVYTEKSNMTGLPGKVSFSPVSGAIDHITNDPDAIRQNPECIATVQGHAMGKGKLNAVFRFNLADKNGAFTVKSTISQLDANQLRPVFTAMTAVEMQSFSMKQMDYFMKGNEDGGTGTLSMQYDNMDILINKVEPDGSFDKKGLLSFLANRLVIYKENPMNGEERKANSMYVQRDATRSFFNLVWQTMFSSARDIVLRPMAQRRIERKKERMERREERRNKRKN